MQELGSSAEGTAPESVGGTLDARTSETADLIIRLIRRMRAPKDDSPAVDELKAQLGRSGLARRHMTALVAIALNEPLSVGELAPHLALSPTTTSQLVNELNRAGLVDRREDDTDRRRTIVALPPHYRAMILPFAQRRLSAIRRALSAMPAAEQEIFLRGFRLLVDVAEEPDPDAGQPRTTPGRSSSGVQEPH
ncbi:MarR family winged helix-turn-helix transcriptional regulator [Actinomadura fibrosa]|uniref:MarR family winged helix-turn-helix transcriptional regulator n=1 Tax=Actinomadura fibrosa TaxID=111802 RepID=A0ABW2XRW9_9ACTN|nr:helix-turn-helix domain-containing protein [Actinomadura fibrosa]